MEKNEFESKLGDLEREVEKISNDFQMFQKILQDTREHLEDEISNLKDYARGKGGGGK